MARRKGTGVPEGFVREGKGLLVPLQAQERAKRAAEALAARIGEGSAADLARRLHWSPSHLSHVLSYRQPLKVSELLALCGEVGESPGRLLEEGKIAGERERGSSRGVPDQQFAEDLEAFVQAAVRAGYNEEVFRQIMLLITQLRG